MDRMEVEKLFVIAIGRELEAHEFYNEVSKKVENDAAKDVFEQLAREEMQHMEILEKLKMDSTAVMNFVNSHTDYKIAESTDDATLSVDMKPADAIQLAMKKEQGAVEFYRDLAEQASDPAVKEIFENLMNMELAHKTRLENVFVEIGYPEVF